MSQNDVVVSEVESDQSQSAGDTPTSKPIHDLIPRQLCLSAPCVAVRWIKENTILIAAPQSAWERITSELGSPDFEYEFISGDESEITDLLMLMTHKDEKSSTASRQMAAISGEASVTELVDELIDQAVLNRASDLHIEPFEDVLRVRIRVDGMLRVLTELPINFTSPITSRVKIMAQLNIVERRRPQDGQFTTMVGTRRVDARVASAATLYGEKIVMRLHDERRPAVSLKELGMASNQLTDFSRSINAVNGLIFAAGPTGSGKTTTLHSALRATSSPFKNVTTIEDPVEYVVPGINQIPVSEANGTGFAVQLRAILRQDPDVILVGETRDAETARISVQAALTGHLVLSSIHATDSIGAVYRLMQMDIEPHLVASSLRSIVSQRLVRKICHFCREEYEPNMTEHSLFESRGLEVKTLMRGVGCTFCGGSGYRDRVAAYQLLTITESLAELISSRPDPAELRRAAVEEGMTTIGYQALVLAQEGVTTMEAALEFLEYFE